MAAGDLTASAPVKCTTSGAIKTAIDALNLGATTDFIKIVPVAGRDHTWYVFKVVRAAS